MFKNMSFLSRKDEFQKINHRYPHLVPVIISPGTDSTPVIDKQKFLVPPDVKCSQLIWVIRKRLDMKPSDGLYLLCQKCPLWGEQRIGDLQKFKSDEDGFLYIDYALESTFG